MPLSSPAELTTTPAETDRRAAVRFLCTADTFLYPVQADGQTGWRAEVKDVSTGGLCLVLGQPFAPGTIIGVELPLPVWQRVALARVVHATPQADGTWLVGCEFAFRLPARELQQVIRAWQRPSAKPSSLTGRRK